MVKKGGKAKKSTKLESLKAAIEEEENETQDTVKKVVKKRKGF